MQGAEGGGVLKSGLVRAAVLAACVIGAGVVIALLRGPLPSDSTRGVELAGAAGAAGVVIAIVFIALILFALLELISLILRGPQHRGNTVARDSRRSMLDTVIAIAVIMIVLLLLLQFGHVSGAMTASQLGSQNSTTRDLGLPATSSGFAGALFGSLAFALFILMMGILVVIVVFALMSLHRAEEKDEQGMGVRTAVAEAVELSIEDVARGKDPREAVVEVYSEMRLKLVQAGALDGLSTTPREFGRGAVERLGLGHGTVHSLTMLYEEAKFSLHPMSSIEKENAVALLKKIVEELRNGE